MNKRVVIYESRADGDRWRSSISLPCEPWETPVEHVDPTLCEYCKTVIPEGETRCAKHARTRKHYK